MKVRIGKYPSRCICNIHTDYMREKYGFDWEKNNTRFEELLEKLEDYVQWVYDHTVNLYFDKREQSVKVKIDKWDTWSMDYTLAYIILPMLKQLKESKHGAPKVDLEDVPKELRPTKAQQKAHDKDGSTDPKFFERWNYVMDEMIWAFEQKCRDDWMGDYTSGVYDIEFKKIEDGEYIGYSEMVEGPNHTLVWDKEGHQAHQDRMSNGFRLFGKYYESLWD